MRVRDQGLYMTFEYAAKSDRQPHALIRRWARRHAGPLTLLNVVNLSTGKWWRVFAPEFMKRGKRR
jgi:hypothetical protein